MLKQRLITALILSILVFGGISYLPSLGFIFFVWLIIFCAAWEYSSLWPMRNNYYWRFEFFIIFVACILLANLGMSLWILIIGGGWWLCAPYLLWCYVVRGNHYLKNSGILQILLGVVMLVPCGLGLITIYNKFGKEFIWYVLAIVWATDVGAYFGGRLFGKQLLLPKISPKKTRAGLWWGVFSGLLVAIGGIFLLKYRLPQITWLACVSLVMLSLVTCLWSVIGDLFESMLKRQAGVKDSGSLLPGHGGVYDRIDSLLAAVPIFTLGLLLMW